MLHIKREKRYRCFVAKHDAHEIIWYLGQCVTTFQYWCIRVDIGRGARSIVSWSIKRVDAAREGYRDVMTSGASEKERTTGGHIWSRGLRGSQVTLASDGASRFHDDVRHVSLFPLSIWEFHLFSPHVASSTPSFLRTSRARLLRAGYQKYRRLFCGWERRGKWEEGEEALFRDYRGLPAFWNHADRLHSQYRACSSFPRVTIFAILEFSHSDLSNFTRGIVKTNT